MKLKEKVTAPSCIAFMDICLLLFLLSLSESARNLDSDILASEESLVDARYFPSHKLMQWA